MQPVQFPNYPTAPVVRPWNGLAIAAFVLMFVPFGGILSIIFGHIALRQIKQTSEQGRGLALTAYIVGWICVVLGIILLIVFIAAAASTPATPAVGMY